jgi:predicted GNAT family N-acyltransferase
MSPYTALVIFGLFVLTGMLLISWGRIRKRPFKVRTAAWDGDRSVLSAIRRRVFIQEQNVPEDMEWDEHDAHAVHFLAIEATGSAIGCARLLADGHFGRMAVSVAWRSKGVGRALLQAAEREALTRGHRVMRLSAQKQAAGFYLRHGYAVVGDDYMEAGIAHVAMQKNLGAAD